MYNLFRRQGFFLRHTCYDTYRTSFEFVNERSQLYPLVIFYDNHLISACCLKINEISFKKLEATNKPIVTFKTRPPKNSNFCNLKILLPELEFIDLISYMYTRSWRRMPIPSVVCVSVQILLDLMGFKSNLFNRKNV